MNKRTQQHTQPEHRPASTVERGSPGSEAVRHEVVLAYLSELLAELQRTKSLGVVTRSEFLDEIRHHIATLCEQLALEESDSAKVAERAVSMMDQPATLAKGLCEADRAARHSSPLSWWRVSVDQFSACLGFSSALVQALVVCLLAIPAIYFTWAVVPLGARENLIVPVTGLVLAALVVCIHAVFCRHMSDPWRPGALIALLLFTLGVTLATYAAEFIAKLDLPYGYIGSYLAMAVLLSATTAVTFALIFFERHCDRYGYFGLVFQILFIVYFSTALLVRVSLGPNHRLLLMLFLAAGVMVTVLAQRYWARVHSLRSMAAMDT